MRVFSRFYSQIERKAYKLAWVFMNDRRDSIEQVLRNAFAPSELRVHDDSSKHAGHAGAKPGGQTHYSVTIIAEAFRGKSRVESHRMVYAALEGMFDQGLHALAINAKAPA